MTRYLVIIGVVLLLSGVFAGRGADPREDIEATEAEFEAA